MGVMTVEIGFPYSDSIADGPVIQNSFHYVLEQGHDLNDTFGLVSDVRSKVECGLVAMVSYSIVHRIGVEEFMGKAAKAGFDGVILPDVPVEEMAYAAGVVSGADLCHIGLVAPTTSPQRREAIARASTGFLYRITVAGTTGERTSLPEGLPDEVAELRRVSGLPVCLGFGISRPDQVREICRFADGAIVGSALIRRIADALGKGAKPSTIVDEASRFLSELLTGTAPDDAQRVS